MHIRHLLPLFLLIGLLGCSRSLPQTPTIAPDPSDLPVPSATHNRPVGSGSASGRVIAGYGMHQPVGGISLFVGNDLEPAAITGEDGRFTLSRLPVEETQVRAGALTFTVTIYADGETADLGTLKMPPEQLPSLLDKQLPAEHDLAELKESSQVIQLITPITITDFQWHHATATDQQEHVWSKRPFRDMPKEYLLWWFQQPAVVYDTVDIFPQSFPGEYDLDPQMADRLALLGAWNPVIAENFQADSNYDRDVLQALYTGEKIEIWLIGYEALGGQKAGDHYFIDVDHNGSFEVVRFAGNGGRQYQIHLIQNGREIARLPRQCRKPGDADCSQPRQQELAFFPSPVPEILKYTPETTPQPPALGRLAVINRSNSQQLIQVARYEPPQNLAEGEQYAGFAFHPDGKRAAFLNVGEAVLVDLETLQVLQRYPLDSIVRDGQTAQVWSLRFSPGGNRLAMLTEFGPVMWDVESGKMLWLPEPIDDPVGTLESFTEMVFSPAGDILVTASIMYGSRARIWSTQTGEMLRSLNWNNQLDVDFSPDGTRLYTIDRLDNIIRAYDTSTWTELTLPQDGGYPHLMTLSPNGELAAVNAAWDGEGYQQTYLFQVDGWKNLGLFIENPEFGFYGPTRIEPSFNRDGGILAIAYTNPYFIEPRSIELWDTSTLKKITTVQAPLTAPLSQIAFSPDGRLLAARYENGTTIFWGVSQ